MSSKVINLLWHWGFILKGLHLWTEWYFTGKCAFYYSLTDVGRVLLESLILNTIISWLLTLSNFPFMVLFGIKVRLNNCSWQNTKNPNKFVKEKSPWNIYWTFSEFFFQDVTVCTTCSHRVAALAHKSAIIGKLNKAKLNWRVFLPPFWLFFTYISRNFD